MGVIPKIPDIYIIFELVQGSLFDLLHMQKNKQLNSKDRVRIARDIAVVF